MVWRIGNGRSIRIKEDKWLPLKANRSIVSPIPTIEPGARVNILIKAETGEWNTPEIQRLFLPHEAATICGIPLSARLPQDRIIWGLTPSGTFTTKSAYKLLVSHASTNLAGTSSLAPQNKFWNDLWKLRVPNKIKHFAWRACNSSLPTMVNLQHRHELHALWACSKLAEVWRSLNWTQQAADVQVSSFQDLMEMFMQTDEDYRKEIFITVAWLLWNRRNASRVGRPTQPLHKITQMAGSYLQEFLNAQEPARDNIEPTPIQQLQQWRPPDAHFFKANFDAAVFKSENLAGLGVVIRDWRGEAIGALTTSVPLAQTVAELEALACRRAVQFAREIGLTQVMFEGDSSTVIQAVQEGSSNVLPYGHVIEDIRMLALEFQSSVFTHVSRAYNVVADALAKKAKTCRGTQVWLEELPEDIASLAGFDVH
ncbi:putative ribonuclease h protein [Quercus suber]|uniref:Ribonuclease h protein n=1 Tax=Quercus suber TaxID=58331 RepID=A0AAW0KPV0_QUESU